MRPRKSWDEAAFEVVLLGVGVAVFAAIVTFFVVIWQQNPWAVAGILAVAATAVGLTIANRYWDWRKEDAEDDD